MRTKKIQPWPWHVEFRQYSQDGKFSRPRIVDALNKPLSLNNVRQITLAAMAPVLLDRLAKLYERADLLHLQIQDLLGFNLPTHPALKAAKELLDVAGRL